MNRVNATSSASGATAARAPDTRADCAAVPLCVDLDGTLLKSDLLLESLLAFVRKYPHRFYMPLFWLLWGRAHLKTKIAADVELDVSLLPFREDVLAYLRNESAQGRPIYIATASARAFAERVAEHFGFFAGIFATGPDRNLKGQAKAGVLETRFGRKGFDYAGNSEADFAIWKVARGCIVVDMPVARAEKACGPIEVRKSFAPARAPGAYLKCLRLHQWLKNTLLFAPLAASHQLDVHSVLTILTAFFSFGFCASGTYIVNDLFDLESDRKHSWKRHRPLASGSVPIHHGIILATALFLGAIALALLVNELFLLVLLGYAASTLLYSAYLKTVLLLDVMMLTFFYTLRVVAGATALSMPLSFWILAFAMFVFLSLAFSKRYAELHSLRDRDLESTPGRDYSLKDIESLRTMGVSAGYGAVLVMALYINSPDVVPRYRSPAFLWLLCPLVLYWINWIWIKASRGELLENPLMFALRDTSSLVILVLATIVYLMAI
jgi:4-hydroxybenzoate polyprenyltransferase